MTIYAYDEDYLGTAQRILGDAFDFAVNTCGFEAKDFAEMFLVSDASKQFEKGNPSYVAGINGCELVRKVLGENGTDISDIQDEMYLDKSPEYWAGWALAFYQWYTGRTFGRILGAVPIEEILYMYTTLHEADIMKFVEIMDEKLSEFYTETNLKHIRRAAGLSQRQLAEMSQVPIRQIQLFEQKQRDINKTQAINLLKLSRALGCSMETLLEI